MTDSTDDLPDDIGRLKACSSPDVPRIPPSGHVSWSRTTALLRTLHQLPRNQFGRKSERLSDDQLNLGLEDFGETAIASSEGAQERAGRDADSVAQT